MNEHRDPTITEEYQRAIRRDPSHAPTFWLGVAIGIFIGIAIAFGVLSFVGLVAGPR